MNPKEIPTPKKENITQMYRCCDNGDPKAQQGYDYSFHVPAPTHGTRLNPNLGLKQEEQNLRQWLGQFYEACSQPNHPRYNELLDNAKNRIINVEYQRRLTEYKKGTLNIPGLITGLEDHALTHSQNSQSNNHTGTPTPSPRFNFG